MMPRCAFFFGGAATIGLSQAHPIRAQFALDLQAMHLQWNVHLFEKIRAEEHPVVALHVNQLDGKHVSRSHQFLAS